MFPPCSLALVILFSFLSFLTELTCKSQYVYLAQEYEYESNSSAIDCRVIEYNQRLESCCCFIFIFISVPASPQPDEDFSGHSPPPPPSGFPGDDLGNAASDGLQFRRRAHTFSHPPVKKRISFEGQPANQGKQQQQPPPLRRQQSFAPELLQNR